MERGDVGEAVGYFACVVIHYVILFLYFIYINTSR
jgi:hypothetical protein